MRTSDIKRLGEAVASVVSPQVGYTDDEIRELCHSKDHNCAVTVIHPEWGKGKPVYESHAIPDDEGNVEWYDVQFKHGLEEKVPASDMEVIEEANHGKKMKKTDEGKREFVAAAKMAKKNGEKTFTFAGKHYDVEEALDPVDDKANDKKFKDRKDKDIDNDGDVDSSDEYLHKRRAATDDAIDGGKKPAKNAKKEAEHDDEDGEDKPDTANGDDEKKKKKNGNPKTDDKTAEISKIGEAVNELNSMFDRLWEAEHSGKRKQDQNNGEPYDDKESPKSKEFENAHKKSDKKIEDNYDDGVAKTTKTEKDGTKAKSGKRPQDNQAGDNKIVNPVKEEAESLEEATDLYNKGGIQMVRVSMGRGKVGVEMTVGNKQIELSDVQFKNLQRALPKINLKQGLGEDFDMDAKDGSISMVELARRQLAGEGKHKDKDMNKQMKENPFDGRTKAAREFLERMNKRRGN